MENNGHFCQIISIIQPGLSFQHNLSWDLSFAILPGGKTFKCNILIHTEIVST